MKCSACGSELAPGSAFCHACGVPTTPRPPASPSAAPGVDHLIAEATRAARELTAAAAGLAMKAAQKAERAARDPEASGKRAMKRLQEEIDQARKDIDAALRNL
jgi:hypothetical protein